MITKYTIKPLVWELRGWDFEKAKNQHEASTVFGTLYCKTDGWGYCFCEPYDEEHMPAKSFDEAKEKAEQFYLERLLAALVEVEQ